MSADSFHAAVEQKLIRTRTILNFQKFVVSIYPFCHADLYLAYITVFFMNNLLHIENIQNVILHVRFVSANIFSLNCFQACVGSAGQHVTTLRLTEANFRLFPCDPKDRRREERRFEIP